jgi:Flp pilus assembly protein TadG
MARAHRDRKDRRFLGERGQGLVEFVLVLPLLCLIILAIVQFGVLWNNYETLTAATREGARKAAVSRTAADPVGAATQAVKDSAYGLDFTQAGASITVTPSTPWTAGSQVTVTATYPYSINLLGIAVKSGSLTSSTKERVE